MPRPTTRALNRLIRPRSRPLSDLADEVLGIANEANQVGGAHVDQPRRPDEAEPVDQRASASLDRQAVGIEDGHVDPVEDGAIPARPEHGRDAFGRQIECSDLGYLVLETLDLGWREVFA